MNDFEISSPVLFNVWKHHAEALRRRVRDAAALGDAGLAALPDQLVVVGTELMDLYTGTLSPAAIGREVLARLTADQLLERGVYAPWFGCTRRRSPGRGSRSREVAPPA